MTVQWGGEPTHIGSVPPSDVDETGSAVRRRSGDATRSLITTPFSFASTADEVVRGINLIGKRVVVTGGASGIGVETARALFGAGAEVTIAVRDISAGARAAADIAGSARGTAVHVAPLDVTDRRSIARFVDHWHGPLHVLINNAGIMMPPEQRTPEGWELQFATNHLGHFALAQGLRGALASARCARVVVVSSSGHLFSPVVFDDLHFHFRPYDPLLAYGQSKTASVMFAVAASARWRSDGISVNALNPGAIATNLQRHVGGQLKTPPTRQKSPQQGAATTVLLAASPQLEGIGGRYFEDCNEAETVTSRNAEATGVADYALDFDNADRLWRASLELLAA